MIANEIDGKPAIGTERPRPKPLATVVMDYLSPLDSLIRAGGYAWANPGI